MNTYASQPGTYASRSKTLQQQTEQSLRSVVRAALAKWDEHDDSWADPIVRAATNIFMRRYRVEASNPSAQKVRAEAAKFGADLRASLEKTANPSDSAVGVALDRVTTFVSNTTINAAILSASETEDGEGLVKVWITMHDDKVRASHREVDKEAQPLDKPFTVGGHKMARPGDMSAPIEEWINCRCVLGIERQPADQQQRTASAVPSEATGGDMDPEQDTLTAQDTTVPWHGVLAPEDVMSGDGRKFMPESLRNRDLPLPLAWQKVSAPGHDGSVVVARIDNIWRENGLIKADGVFLALPEADEVVGMVAEGGLRGVSVDVDDATFSILDADGNLIEDGDVESMYSGNTTMAVTDGRICGATICSIPAFQEAYIALGTWPTEDAESLAASCACEAEVYEGEWDGDPERYTAEQWFNATIVHLSDDRENKADHLLPILTPTGALSRPGVEAAVTDLAGIEVSDEQRTWASAALVAAFDAFEEEAPEHLTDMFAWVDEVNEFPEVFAEHDLIWIENRRTPKVVNKGAKYEPKPSEGKITKRRAATADEEKTIRNGGWVRVNEKGDKPGDGGYMKKKSKVRPQNNSVEFPDGFEFVKTEDGPGWLTHPVDTDRLRDYWAHGKGAAKIGWGIPGDFNRCRAHLAKYVKPQYLSGYCANRHYDALGFWPGGEGGKRLRHHSGETAPAFTLTAAGAPMKYKASDFADPGLKGPTAIKVTDDGRVFGHIATWGVCHIGIQDKCVQAPKSNTDYAYFKTGYVSTDEGDLATGVLTVDCGHAPSTFKVADTISHYDDMGTAVADVNVGEDEFGIWCSGRIRPDATEEQVRAFRAASLSGDWRAVGGNLEMVAALGVNVPGFPIPRPALAASGGREFALTAAGVVPPTLTASTGPDISAAVLAGIQIYKQTERDERMSRVRAEMGLDAKSRMAALAAEFATEEN